MNIDPQEDLNASFVKHWNERVKTIRWLGFALGSILLLLGIVNFFWPYQFASMVGKIIAAIIVLSGIYRLVDYFTTPVFFRFGGKLVSGIFNLAIGYLLFVSSGQTMLTVFTIIMAIELALVGIEKLVYAGKLRYLGAQSYGWVIVDAVMNLIGSLIFVFLPNITAAALSIFVGIFLVVAGASILIECINVREYELKPAHTKSGARRVADAKEAEVLDDLEDLEGEDD